MAPRQPRTRPTLTVTIDAEHMRRLKRLVCKMPGGKLSSLVDEMVGMCLPVFEEVVAAYEAARRPDGTTDEAIARERFGAYLGTTLLQLHNFGEDSDEGGDTVT